MESLNLTVLPPENRSSNSSRQCRSCRAVLPTDAEFCGACGTQNPTSPFVSCFGCGTEVPVNQGFCNRCGARNGFAQAPTPQPAYTPGPSTSNSAYVPSFSHLSGYYQDEFERMQEDPRYEGKWNWAAFFFGALWAITKGLWGPVLLCLIISIPFGGLPAILFWVYFGARGNSMYYKKEALGQPWAFW